MSGTIAKPASEWLDFAEEKRKAHAARSLPFHVEFLNNIASGILPIDLILLGAITGAGKTSLGIDFACRNSADGHRVIYLGLEAHRGEIEQRLVYNVMAKMAWDRLLDGRMEISYGRWCHGRCDFLDAAFYREAKEIVRERTRSLVTHYRTAKFGGKDLIETIKENRYEADLIVLDHLHFIDNDSDDELRGMKAIVKELSDTIQDTETPVVAIAHLRKSDGRRPRLVPELSDFHGSSDITKIATMAIVLAPAHEETTEPGLAMTYMRLPKERKDGDTGLTALLAYDIRNNNYHKEYDLGRIQGDKFVPLQMEMVPWWARENVRIFRNTQTEKAA